MPLQVGNKWQENKIYYAEDIKAQVKEGNTHFSRRITVSRENYKMFFFNYFKDSFPFYTEGHLQQVDSNIFLAIFYLFYTKIDIGGIHKAKAYERVI